MCVGGGQRQRLKHRARDKDSQTEGGERDREAMRSRD